MPGSEYSRDLETPPWIWVVLILYPSGKKYKEYFMPLANGGIPRKMKKLVNRLEYRLAQERQAYIDRNPEINVGPRDARRPKNVELEFFVPPFSYKIIEMYPAQHTNRPQLFDSPVPVHFRLEERTVNNSGYGMRDLRVNQIAGPANDPPPAPARRRRREEGLVEAPLEPPVWR